MKRLMMILTAALLSGCVTTEAPKQPCPQTGVLPQAEKAIFLKDYAAGVTPANTITTAGIGNFRGGCRPKVKDNPAGGLEFSLEIDFTAMRGAALTQGATELPYFIAVISPDDDILQRTAFTTEIEYADNGRGLETESHTITVPMPDVKDAGLYKIAIGYILTPEQTALNEKKIPDGIKSR